MDIIRIIKTQQGRRWNF